MATEETDLTTRVREVIAEELMLDRPASEIDPDALLFGPDGLGLDSVDALQLVVAIEKHFGLKVGNAEAAKEILRSVKTICRAIEEQPPKTE